MAINVPMLISSLFSQGAQRNLNSAGLGSSGYGYNNPLSQVMQMWGNSANPYYAGANGWGSSYKANAYNPGYALYQSGLAKLQKKADEDALAGQETNAVGGTTSTRANRNSAQGAPTVNNNSDGFQKKVNENTVPGTTPPEKVPGAYYLPDSIRGNAMNTAYNSPYADTINQVSLETGVPSEMLYRIMLVESGGDPSLVSSAGATGLFQFMPGTAASYGFDPNDPNASVKGAAQYYNDLIKNANGDIRAVIGGYNMGEPGFNKWYSENNGDYSTINPESAEYLNLVFGDAYLQGPIKYEGGTFVQYLPDGSKRILMVPGVAANQATQQTPVSKSSSSNTPRTMSTNTPAISDPQTQNNLLSTAMSYQGTPYGWGAGRGSDKSKMDCSAFVSTVYEQGAGIKLPAQTSQMIQKVQLIGNDVNQAQPGDLVFYGMNQNDPKFQHVAIYIGNGYVIDSTIQNGTDGVAVRKFNHYSNIDGFYRVPGYTSTVSPYEALNQTIKKQSKPSEGNSKQQPQPTPQPQLPAPSPYYGGGRTPYTPPLPQPTPPPKKGKPGTGHPVPV
jgi:cell wall-associated NlpC family hydrolase